MKAIFFKDQALSMVDRPVPEIKENEVLIKTLCAGICNTDVELFRGYYGFSGIAGHEFVGRVKKAPTRPELEGTRVVVDINYACRTCSWCLSGKHRHCPNRQTLGIVAHDGAFAEHVSAPLANVLPVADSVSDHEAAFTELLAAALEVTQQVHVTNSQRVLVLGDGKLGLLIALTLRFANPGLTLVGKHEDKLAIARAQGIETIRVASQDELGELAKQQGQYDLVVEVTGKEDGVARALDFVRPEGTLVVKTTSHKLSEIDMARVVVDEISMVGSRCGDMDLALKYLKNNWVDIPPLIEAVYPFNEFETAFKHALKPGAKKVLIDF